MKGQRERERERVADKSIVLCKVAVGGRGGEIYIEVKVQERWDESEVSGREVGVRVSRVV